MHKKCFKLCSPLIAKSVTNGQVDISSLSYLPGEQPEEGSSLISVFFSLPFEFIFTSSPTPSHRQSLPVRPPHPTMPSNTVTHSAAFKGSDYADSPGSKMVRGQDSGVPPGGFLRGSVGLGFLSSAASWVHSVKFGRFQRPGLSC